MNRTRSPPPYLAPCGVSTPRALAQGDTLAAPGDRHDRQSLPTDPGETPRSVPPMGAGQGVAHGRPHDRIDRYSCNAEQNTIAIIRRWKSRRAGPRQPDAANDPGEANPEPLSRSTAPLPDGG